MAVDWTRTRATVERMINQYGRTIQLIDDAVAADSTDPLGPPGVPTTVDVKGVFVRPSGYIKLGETFQMEVGMWTEVDKIVLVLPSLTQHYEKFTRVIDSDNTPYKIFKTDSLAPGDVPLLLYLGLRQ